MKKVLLKMAFLAFVVIMPVSVMGQVHVSVNIPLPPPIIFPAPPHMVVIPETHVYAAPDVQADIFFSGGWWWRLWDGRWYRSHYYDRGWAHYRGVPAFYRHVPPGWRNDYRDRRWKGHPWDHRLVPHHDVEKNWRHWQRDKYWEKQNHWGVKALDRPAPGKHPNKGRYDGHNPKDARYDDKPGKGHHDGGRDEGRENQNHGHKGHGPDEGGRYDQPGKGPDRGR